MIIFVHGLGDYQNEPQFYNGTTFFSDNGFDIFRFDLYSWEEDARNLIYCDINTHATDVSNVINHFKNKYKQIFIVGHSLETLSLLFVNQELIITVILWN